jgi:hypothetical protein
VTRSQRLAPKVGIIYIFGGKFLIDSTPVAPGMNVGDFVIHERDHQRYWNQLVRQRAVPKTVFSTDANALRGEVESTPKSIG